jgi:1,2-phenylacetyl-CoA epoxidase catalytic subunit
MKLYSEKIHEIRKIFEAEQSELQKEYQDYFKKKLEKFGVESPADMDVETKKKFFNEIADEWEVGKGLKK